jgi:16S rRNA (guanine527-N7)-methyltransferase
MEKLTSGAQKLGLNITPQQLEQFVIYYQELVAWNRKINLTRITDYEEVQVKHFLDSLTVMPALKPPDDGRALNIIDVGAGAGLPGLPLKIVIPDTELTLLEATARKAEFLEHLVKTLELNKVEVVNGRAEEVAHDSQYRERYDLVLSRAVAPLPALVELTLPFGRMGGYLVAPKKGDIKDEIGKSKKAIEVMGGALREVRPVELEGLNDGRYLVVIDKVRPTPAEYPRRPGIPAKRPLIS